MVYHPDIRKAIRSEKITMGHIYYQKGSIFDSTARVIVNPVNCKGVMGKGLALAFEVGPLMAKYLNQLDIDVYIYITESDREH
jgi:hypothetical protein